MGDTLPKEESSLKLPTIYRLYLLRHNPKELQLLRLMRRMPIMINQRSDVKHIPTLVFKFEVKSSNKLRRDDVPLESRKAHAQTRMPP